MAGPSRANCGRPSTGTECGRSIWWWPPIPTSITSAGLVGLAGRIPVGQVWQAEMYEPSPVWDRLTERVRRSRGAGTGTGDSGSRHRFGDLDLEVLGPTRRFDELNDQSLVVLVRRGDYSILFSGDIEASRPNGDGDDRRRSAQGAPSRGSDLDRFLAHRHQLRSWR